MKERKKLNISKSVTKEVISGITEEAVNEEGVLEIVPAEEKVIKADVMPGIAFTYIGGGADSPTLIKFMNKIKFRRGFVTVVPITPDNEQVIKKLRKNQCFVEGEIDIEELDAMDIEAKEAETKQQQINYQRQLIEKKRNQQ